MNKHPLHFARWSVILDNSNIKESAEEWTKVHSSLLLCIRQKISYRYFQL